MKAVIVLFAAVLRLTTAAGQTTEEPYLVKLFEPGNIKNINVSTSGGAINVTAGDNEKARVEVYVKPNNPGAKNWSDEDIRSILKDNYSLDISLTGNELRASASSNNNLNWKRSLNISFRLFVPAEVSSKLHTNGGNIRLSGLKGRQDFSTSGGSIYIEDLSGEISGKTSGGSIHAKGSKGTIDLKTSGGSIDAGDCSGVISLLTSGGSLKLNNLEGDIDTRTSGGSISGSSIQGKFYTHTSGGSIKLEDLSCSLDASTSAGRVHAAFVNPGSSVKIDVGAGNASLVLPASKGMLLDLRGRKINAGSLSNFKGSVQDDHIRGSINGGGSDINVNAGNGSVSVSWK